MIRQSNLELELDKLEERHVREMREEGLLSPVLIKTAESESDAEEESPLDQPAGVIPFWISPESFERVNVLRWRVRRSPYSIINAHPHTFSISLLQTPQPAPNPSQQLRAV